MPCQKTFSRHPQIRPLEGRGKYLPAISGRKTENYDIYTFLPSVWSKYDLLFAILIVRFARCFQNALAGISIIASTHSVSRQFAFSQKMKFSGLPCVSLV